MKSHAEYCISFRGTSLPKQTHWREFKLKKEKMIREMEKLIEAERWKEMHVGWRVGGVKWNRAAACSPHIGDEDRVEGCLRMECGRWTWRSWEHGIREENTYGASGNYDWIFPIIHEHVAPSPQYLLPLALISTTRNDPTLQVYVTADHPPSSLLQPLFELESFVLTLGDKWGTWFVLNMEHVIWNWKMMQFGSQLIW